MSKKFQIDIPIPCHENWEKMNPVEQGRYCKACSKEVVDFTNMSDRELAQFFKKPFSGSTCGRFAQEQLNRNIVVGKKRIPWLRYFFQVAIPAFLLTKQGHTQGKLKLVEMPQVVTTETRGVVGDTIILPMKDELRIEIIDSNTRLPVPYASIEVKDMKKAFSADSTGKYSLVNFSGKKELELVVSSVGYQTLERNYIIKNGVIQVPLVQDAEIMDSIIMTAYPTIVCRQLVAGFTAIKLVETDTIFDTIQVIGDKIKNWITPTIHPVVYPNPVQRGQEITIEWKGVRDEEVRIIVQSANGSMVHSREVKPLKGNNRLQLPTGSGWSAGIYFIRFFKREKQVGVEKIVVY